MLTNKYKKPRIKLQIPNDLYIPVGDYKVWIPCRSAIRKEVVFARRNNDKAISRTWILISNA